MPVRRMLVDGSAIAVAFEVPAQFRLSKQLVIISRRVSRFIFAKFQHPISRLCRVRHLENLQTLHIKIVHWETIQWLRKLLKGAEVDSLQLIPEHN